MDVKLQWCIWGNKFAMDYNFLNMSPVWVGREGRELRFADSCVFWVDVRDGGVCAVVEDGSANIPAVVIGGPGGQGLGTLTTSSESLLHPQCSMALAAGKAASVRAATAGACVEHMQIGFHASRLGASQFSDTSLPMPEGKAKLESAHWKEFRKLHVAAGHSSTHRHTARRRLCMVLCAAYTRRLRFSGQEEPRSELPTAEAAPPTPPSDEDQEAAGEGPPPVPHPTPQEPCQPWPPRQAPSQLNPYVSRPEDNAFLLDMFGEKSLHSLVKIHECLQHYQERRPVPAQDSAGTLARELPAGV
ncbi:hypothetical protein CRUP_017345 [Coryphaenoides rupestris]|nr:hypothetical protein CRUP_017345 [Coryphaenoides rupestris]